MKTQHNLQLFIKFEVYKHQLIKQLSYRYRKTEKKQQTIHKKRIEYLFILKSVDNTIKRMSCLTLLKGITL